MNKLELQYSLEKIYKLSEDNHSIYTPFDLCENMIDYIQDLNGDILVISNLEFLIILKTKGVNMNNIYYSTSCELKKRVAINLGVSLNNILELEYNKEILTTKMKFDIIVANPPYQKGLHLKFLDKALDLIKETGEIIFVHPSEWLVQKRKTSRTKLHDILKDKINGADISFIDNPWGFDAALFVPLCITHVTNSKNFIFTDSRTKIYGDLPTNPKEKVMINSLYEIACFGNTENTLSFVNKFFDYCKNDNWKKYEKVNNGNFYINLVSIAGGGKTTFEYNDGVERNIPNMYSIINEVTCDVFNEPQFAKTGSQRIWFSFKTKEEAENSLNFVSRSKIFRSYLSIIKIDQHAADSLLPWLPWLDWTQEWTDDKLIEFFNLSNEEVQNIEEIINIITIKK